MITTVRTSISVLLLLLTGTLLHAEGVQFFKGTWQEALDLAAKENKYIMVDAYTDWCGWCKVMDKETFTDAGVGAVVNENFIPVKINFEEGIGIDLGMKLRVNSYPTILFFNPAGQLVHIQHGYTPDNQEFIAECRKALAVKEERVFAFDSRDLNVPFPEFYRTSFLKGEDRAWPEEEEVVEVLDAQEDLFSEVSWSVMWRFGGGEKYQKHLLANFNEYVTRYGEEEVRDVVSGQIQGKVYAAAKEKNEKMMREALAPLDEYVLSGKQEMWKLVFEQFYYEQTEEWNKYAGIGEKMIAQDPTNVNRINSICWTLYENSDDQETLAKAAEWMKPVLEAEPENWMYIDTYAALLYKTGNPAEAEKQARKAIRIGEEEGDDVSGTKELLEKITGTGVSGS